MDQQIVNTPQIFPDNVVPGDKVSELTVSKLVSGIITSQQISLAILNDAGDVYIKAGTVDVAAWTATGGFILGMDDSASNVSKMFIGTTGSSMDWNVTTPDTLTIVGSITATSGTIGGFSIGADYIRDTANSFGLASTVTAGDDVRIWAGATFASRATAPARIYESGDFHFGSPTQYVNWDGSVLTIAGDLLFINSVTGAITGIFDDVFDENVVITYNYNNSINTIANPSIPKTYTLAYSLGRLISYTDAVNTWTLGYTNGRITTLIKT